MRVSFHKHIKIIGLIFMSSFVFSCEKNSHVDFIGTWISTDLVDTLEFTSDKDFYKMISGVPDHFDYELLKNDKIKIAYNGMSFVLVTPSVHNYRLEDNTVLIDFRPGCYGFRSQLITFKRQY